MFSGELLYPCENIVEAVAQIVDNDDVVPCFEEF